MRQVSMHPSKTSLTAEQRVINRHPSGPAHLVFVRGIPLFLCLGNLAGGDQKAQKDGKKVD